jgi:predicted nucleotide-binding protein
MNETLSALIQEGLSADFEAAAMRWLGQVEEYLRLAFSDDEMEDFRSRTTDSNYYDAVRRGVGYLQGLRDRHASKINDASVREITAGRENLAVSKRVFVVHGHNNETKVIVARYLEKLGLEPIILHEQPDSGNTVIEKFEIHSAVSFAVVLLTADDLGAAKSEQTALRPRARQNVVFELGYFVGRLSRRRVCALYSGDVEMPSDYHGVLYVPIDSQGAWKTKLAQEFVEARMPIDLNGLL